MGAQIASSFEETTLYQSKTSETKMKQEQSLMEMNMAEQQLKLKEECENAKMAQEEQTVTTKAQLEKDTREVIAHTSKELALFEADTHAEVQNIKTEAELEVAVITAEVLKMKTLSEAEVQKASQSLSANAVSFERKKYAEAEMDVAGKLSEGRKAVAVAEGQATNAFAARRYQEQELKRLSIVENI